MGPTSSNHWLLSRTPRRFKCHSSASDVKFKKKENSFE